MHFPRSKLRCGPRHHVRSFNVQPRLEGQLKEPWKCPQLDQVAQRRGDAGPKAEAVFKSENYIQMDLKLKWGQFAGLTTSGSTGVMNRGKYR